MKSWLKGGLIGLFLFVLYFIGVILFFCSGGPFGGGECTISKFIKIIPDIIINTGVIFVLVVLFLLGVLIGWIVGKTKSKK